MNKKFVLCLFLLQATTALLPANSMSVCNKEVAHTSAFAIADTELEFIRAKFCSSSRFKTRIDANRIDILIQTIKEDGSWADINYIDVSRKGFRHTKHLGNLKLLGAAYSVDGQKFFHNKEVKEAFDKALNFWLIHDFKAENWWHNEFGTPKAMKDLLLIMDDSLTESQAAKMLEIASRANSKAPGARASGDRISIIGIEAEVALFSRDSKKFKQCIENISKEIRFGASDGSNKCLQHDYSFHHRKDRVDNTLSYGLQYANDLAMWIDKVSGTQYEFPESSIRLVTDFYLDGICKHMVYGIYEDTGHMNRDISRKKALSAMSTSTPQRLINASNYRKDELQSIIDLRKGETTRHEEYAKFFWQSEYLTVQRRDFFTSVRMFSTRNMNMEIAYNGEGLRNHYRGDGTNYLTLHGDEYHSLPPVYDWMRIPGVTSVITDEMPSYKEIQKAGKMDFAGAVTDGYYASAAFDFISSHHPLKGKKSWFFFDDEYICLGAGIHSESDNEVVTTLNQTTLKSEVTTDKGILPEGEHHLEGVKWIHHDKVTYIFPYQQDVYLNNQAVSGYWSNITSQTSASKELETEKVLKIWTNHGIHCNNEDYAYITVINKNKKEIRNYTNGHALRILSNNKRIQAVEKPQTGIVFANFFEADTLSPDKNLTLKMQTPGLILIKRNTKGKVLSVTCSDPTRKLEHIDFTLNGKTYHVELKAGNYAGTSETITIDQ